MCTTWTYVSKYLQVNLWTLYSVEYTLLQSLFLVSFFICHFQALENELQCFQIYQSFKKCGQTWLFRFCQEKSLLDEFLLKLNVRIILLWTSIHVQLSMSTVKTQQKILQRVPWVCFCTTTYMQRMGKR